jgi:hypothetical protein
MNKRAILILLLVFIHLSMQYSFEFEFITNKVQHLTFSKIIYDINNPAIELFE